MRCIPVLLVLATFAPAAEGPAPAPAAVGDPATGKAIAAAIDLKVATGPTDPATVSLTLAAAIAYALDRHENPRIAAERIEAARAQRRQALSLLKPSLTLTASAASASNDHRPFAGQRYETEAAALSLDLSIFNAAAFPALKAAGTELAASELDAVDTRRSLAFSVADAYLAALSARSRITAAERRVVVSDATIRDAKARFDAGLTTRTDVTRAELERARAGLAVVQSRQVSIDADLVLAELIVVDTPAQSLAAVDEIATPAGTAAELRHLALDRRADLKALGLRADTAALLVRKAEAGYLPSVAVSAGAATTQTDRPNVPNPEPEWSLRISASWKLYDGGLREGQIDAAGADLGIAEQRISSARRGLRRSIDSAVASIETSRAALSQSEAALRLAEQNHDQVSARYRQGLSTALEEADAASGAFSAEVDLVAAKLDLQRAILNLRQITGAWPLTE